MKEKNILVLGVGNVLFTDDGIGVRVAHKLNEEYDFPDNVNVVDGGVLGINLLGVISDYNHLIVVDTILKKGKPGDLYRLENEEIRKRILPKNSLHQVDLLEALTLCEALPNGVPHTIIIGIEPKDWTSLSTEMNEEVKSKTQDLINMVLKELDKLGATYTKRKEKNVSCYPF